jgi:hypothetical protein
MDVQEARFVWAGGRAATAVGAIPSLRESADAANYIARQD